jgi:hypothetical protein|tara:strand:+ start:1858 stop:2052 length:195 start_codon:yes stop_codon:yes gene_type:complete
MDKEIILVILVVGLVILSGAQAFEINDIKQDLQQGTLTLNSPNGINAPANIVRQVSQPSMVGGC